MARIKYVILELEKLGIETPFDAINRIRIEIVLKRRRKEERRVQKIRTIDKLSSNYEISKKLIYEVKEADLNEFKFTKLDYLVYSSTYDFQYVALIKR